MSLPKHFDPTLEHPEHAIHGERRRTKRRHAVRWLLTVALLAIVYKFYHPEWLQFNADIARFRGGSDAYACTASSDAYFNWDTLSPSDKLNWTTCYVDFECARLLVPLDYADPRAGQAAVAMVRYPSSIPRDDEKYLGPILINPGGPGGSGVQAVLRSGRLLRDVVGEGFDLIGFDPRGVGATTPRLTVFPVNGENGFLFANFLPTVNSSENALGGLYATSQSLGTLTKARMENVAQHVSTPVVARDMMRITQAHGRDKIQYWGFSYGTVLGATFAAMFPNNVGRLVIDGVVDSDDYYTSSWMKNLQDTDAGLFQVYQACVNAGPTICPMHEDSAQKLHDRVQKLLTRLRAYPVSFYNETTGSYGQVDYSLTTRVIFTTLYKPSALGKSLILALEDLERGHAEPIYQMSEAKGAQGLLTESCTCPSLPSDPFSLVGREVTLAIACSDSDVVKDDVDTLREYYANMAQDSIFAEAWWPRLGCAGWKVRAKERFTASMDTNTSFPLLMVGNTADPVTPLQNAHKMSKGFKNSVVLTQNSPGHCSISSASLCTATAIRAYFQNGTLPKEGTVCEVQNRVFGEAEQLVAEQGLNTQERKILRASRGLQEKYLVPIL